jgi:hypothetical protein
MVQKKYQIHAGGARAPASTNKSIFRDYTQQFLRLIEIIRFNTTKFIKKAEKTQFLLGESKYERV